MSASFEEWIKANEKHNAGLLLISLSAAVPLWIHRWKDRSWEERTERAKHCAQIVGEKGDVLQYGGKGCAEAFNALAEGLAILSFAPGGVKFAGQHWESTDGNSPFSILNTVPNYR